MLSMVVATLLCVAVGLSLALLGGGGSVLMVPVFIYVAKMDVASAIALSLLITGLASALGSIKYFKDGFVNKRLVLLFVIPGTVASIFGAKLAKSVPAEMLIFLFGFLMMLIAGILFKKSSKESGKNQVVVCRPNFFLSVTIGTFIGFLTGLLGVGGGFLIVPAIALLMRCSLYTAIGTSLTIIAFNSLSAFSGHLLEYSVGIGTTISFLSATLTGAFIGTKLSSKLDAALIQKSFSVLIFLVGLFLVAANFSKVQGGVL